MRESFVPPPCAEREALHNEIHARPATRIRAPALVIYVAVLNDLIDKSQELAHLQQLDPSLTAADLEPQYLRLRLPNGSLKWERHSEFTRYSLVQPIPPESQLGASEPNLTAAWMIPSTWWQSIPGQTLAAVHVGVFAAELNSPELMPLISRWLGPNFLTASRIGTPGHAIVATDFQLRPDGFERMVVVASQNSSDTRIGRVVQRMLEVETYRLLALRGLATVKSLNPTLGPAEQVLARLAGQIAQQTESDPALLERLVNLAAQVESEIALHTYRFAATRAYYDLVQQRIAALRETAVSGTPRLGEFLQRRLQPAMATVNATALRLESLSERIARNSSLLRTRVDISTELQNQQLLSQLTRGQALQLRLQSTVEGLSIAAISYYIISLILYGTKALNGFGLPLKAELVAGIAIPFIVCGTWLFMRRLHHNIKSAKA